MKHLLNNLIEVIGIDDILPAHSKYYKQFQIQETLCIPAEKPDMEQILSISARAEITETLILSTPKAQSCEGQILTGKKLLIRGKLIQKIEYVANHPFQPVHAAEFEKLFSNYVILDKAVDCNHPLTVTPYIEDIYIKKISKREIFKNVVLVVDVSSAVLNLSGCKINNNMNSLTESYNHSRHFPCKVGEAKYFTQFDSTEKIKLPDGKPDMEQIISAIIDPEIISTKVINSMKGLSAEGQYTSGKKIVLELKIRQKLLYAADVKNQSIHGIENVYYQSVYIVVPEYIEGTSPEILLKNKLLQPKLTIEDVFVKQVDRRCIFKNVLIYLEMCYIPTYELCFSYHNNCTSSNLWIMYENGDHNIAITQDEDKKNVKPLWSPDGQFIAYLTVHNGKSMLHTMDLRSLAINCMTYPEIYDYVSSFCWSADSRNIIFSASKGNKKDLFSVNTNDLNFTQLTHGNGLVKSYKPKCSPEGNRLAYLKSSSNISNLWVADIDGFNSSQITENGYVKDFDWIADSRKITVLTGKGDAPDTLFSIDVDTREMKLLLDRDNIFNKRCIKASPDGRYIAFIGANGKNNCPTDINDIYIYEFCNKAVFNLTRNIYGIKISDFVWKIDSNKIYYSTNELGYYNVYSISLKDFCKRQLTNSCASNIELSYRPRVK